MDEAGGELLVPAEVYTKQEVAQLLKISIETVTRMIDRGDLPIADIPGVRAIRIPKDAVDKMLGK